MYVDDTPAAFDKEQGYVINYHAIYVIKGTN